MKTTLALEFATNIFGKIKPEIKQRLQSVIDNPCQETWDDTHCIILNGSGRMITLWKAVLLIRPEFCRSKPYDMPWPEIPTSEEIVEAIKIAVYKEDPRRKPLN
jgi:hypothetical protein